MFGYISFLPFIFSPFIVFAFLLFCLLPPSFNCKYYQGCIVIILVLFLLCSYMGKSGDRVFTHPLTEAGLPYFSFSSLLKFFPYSIMVSNQVPCAIWQVFLTARYTSCYAILRILKVSRHLFFSSSLHDILPHRIISLDIGLCSHYASLYWVSTIKQVDYTISIIKRSEL